MKHTLDPAEAKYPAGHCVHCEEQEVHIKKVKKLLHKKRRKETK
jgi:hypothetical protein